MFKSVQSRVTVFVAVACSLTSPLAFASAESEAALDSILAEATALIAKGWLIVVPITVAMIGFKLFKKVGQRST